MKCQLTSIAYQKVMISREVKGNTYKDVCGGEKQKVVLGYNNEQGFFKVENNTLLQYPPQSGIKLRGERPYISHEWEVWPIFFKAHNIEPVWVYCDGMWGRYDEDQGEWTGSLGKVRCHNAEFFSISYNKVYNINII